MRRGSDDVPELQDRLVNFSNDNLNIGHTIGCGVFVWIDFLKKLNYVSLNRQLNSRMLLQYDDYGRRFAAVCLINDI